MLFIENTIVIKFKKFFYIYFFLLLVNFLFFFISIYSNIFFIKIFISLLLIIELFLILFFYMEAKSYIFFFFIFIYSFFLCIFSVLILYADIKYRDFINSKSGYYYLRNEIIYNYTIKNPEKISLMPGYKEFKIENLINK